MRSNLGAIKCPWMITDSDNRFLHCNNRFLHCNNKFCTVITNVSTVITNFCTTVITNVCTVVPDVYINSRFLHHYLGLTELQISQSQSRNIFLHPVLFMRLFARLDFTFNFIRIRHKTAPDSSFQLSTAKLIRLHMEVLRIILAFTLGNL